MSKAFKSIVDAYELHGYTMDFIIKYPEAIEIDEYYLNGRLIQYHSVDGVRLFKYIQTDSGEEWIEHIASVVGIDLSNAEDTTAVIVQYQEPVRRHKKKRINKKWAKRYGYRTKIKVHHVETVNPWEANSSNRLDSS